MVELENFFEIFVSKGCWQAFSAHSFPKDCVNEVALNVTNLILMILSIIVKIPQILQIWGAESVLGISESTYFLDTFFGCIYFGYNYLKGNPFSTWGETIFIDAQNLILFLLYWAYHKPSHPKFSRNLRVIYLLFLCGFYWAIKEEKFDSYSIGIMGFLPFPVTILTYVPQIIKNYKQQHTGQISLSMVLILLCGNSVRTYTSIFIAQDFFLSLYFVTGTVLKGIMFYQILYFYKSTQKLLKTAESKKLS